MRLDARTKPVELRYHVFFATCLTVGYDRRQLWRGSSLAHGNSF